MPPKLLYWILLDRVVVAELPIMRFAVVLEKWYCCSEMAFVLAVRYLSASTKEAPIMEVDHTQVESSCCCTLPAVDRPLEKCWHCSETAFVLALE
jgi:hypothetical protein